MTEAWRAKQVRQRAVPSLLPYLRNARSHPSEQITALVQSIREFGFYAPIVIDEAGEIIAGHGRLLAAQSLGWATVPTITREGLTEPQKRALRIFDNKIAEQASWDNTVLAQEFEFLTGAGIDMSLTGFSLDAIDLAFGGSVAGDPAPVAADASPDAVEAAPVAIPRVTETGDCWALGNHRLMCGSSTDARAVAALMDGDRAALCFTSPPYGNQRDYTTGGISDWDELMRGVFRHLDLVMRADGQILVNLGLVHNDQEWQPYWQGWIEWMRAVGWNRFGWYVWDQGPGMPGDWNGRLGPSFEFIFHFNRMPRQPNKTVTNKEAGRERGGGQGMRATDGTVGGWTGSSIVSERRIPDSVIRLGRAHPAGNVSQGAGHPAIFPTKLPQFCMEAYTAAGDLVFEPFSGSATTIIAGEQCGRIIRGMELAPEYVDLSIARWQALYPSQQVRLIAPGTAQHGLTYSMVQAARASAKQ